MKSASTGIKAPSTEAIVILNDGVMRMIGIPLFGIVIPNVTGLFGHLDVQQLTYWLGYIYFILLSAAIWHGNRYLLFRTRKRFTWFDRPIEKLILLVFNNVFYTTPLTIAWLCLWYRWAGFPAVDWNTIFTVALINVICVLFVTHVYETVFMVKEHENEQLAKARLHAAKVQAELTALRNQIDPHFIFNTLNGLTHLITTDSSKALRFTENLAAIYRYILAQKDCHLVTLEDEMEFVGRYTDLVALRFGHALAIDRSPSMLNDDVYLIPPISVFVAIENIIKHNELAVADPLIVSLSIVEDCLVVLNQTRAKKSIVHSQGIGLRNLDERFRITTGKRILTEHRDGEFVVRLPLVSLNN
jgi:sensor histidine kinase YesM